MHGLRPQAQSRWVALIWLSLSALPQTATAGEPGFWDAVRQPALVRYRALVRKAEGALSKQAFQDAAELAGEASEAVPGRPEAHLLRARARLAQRRATDARDAFFDALAASGTALDDPTLAHQAAHAAMLAGDCDFAARVLKRASGLLEDGAERQRTFMRLGDARMCTGPEGLADALLAYGHALRSDAPARQSLPLRLGMALALRRAGQAERADSTLQGVAIPDRIERSLRDHVLPESERTARIAVGLAAMGDTAGARLAWREAAALGGPWQTFHSAQAHAPSASDPVARPAATPRAGAR